MNKTIIFLISILIIYFTMSSSNYMGDIPVQDELPAASYEKPIYDTYIEYNTACVIDSNKSITSEEIGKIRAEVLNNYYKKQNKSVKFIGYNTKLPNGKVVAYMFKVDDAGVSHEYMAIALDNDSIADACDGALRNYYILNSPFRYQYNRLYKHYKYVYASTGSYHVTHDRFYHDDDKNIHIGDIRGEGIAEYYSHCGVVRNKWVILKNGLNDRAPLYYKILNEMEIKPNEDYMITHGSVSYNNSCSDFKSADMWGSNYGNRYYMTTTKTLYYLPLTIKLTVPSAMICEESEFEFEGTKLNIIFPYSSVSQSDSILAFKSDVDVDEPINEFPILMKIDFDFAFYKKMKGYEPINSTTYVVVFKPYN